MPNAADYKKAFGLIKGMILKDKKFSFELINLSVGHNAIKMYHEYEYPIKLEFIGSNETGNEKTLLNLIKKNINSKDGCIVYTQYGNPYECKFGSPHVEKVIQEKDGQGDECLIEVKSTGHAVKRSDIPNLKQQNEQKRKNSVSRSKSKGKTRKSSVPSNYEVRTSHFATGKCSKCSKKISVGDKIVKPKSEMGKKGGWSHLKCIN